MRRLGVVAAAVAASLVVGVPAAIAVINVTRAELSGNRLRVEGTGAVPNAGIVIDGGGAFGQADGGGAFRIERDGFVSPSCVITISDGSSTVQRTLSGCTPTQAPPPPPPQLQAPTLLAPAAGATAGQPVTLSWSAVQGSETAPVKGYDYQLATAATFAAVMRWGHSSTTSTAGTNMLPKNISGLPNGAYVWRVRAVASTGTDFVRGPWSEVRALTISGSAANTPAAPTFTAPTDRFQFRPLECMEPEWTPIEGAAYYLYEVDDEPTFAEPNAMAGLGNTKGTKVNGCYGEPFGVLYQRVAAVSADGVRGPSSPVMRFEITYNAPIPPPPVPVAPADGAEVQMPLTFDWTDVSYAQSYELQIDDEPTFTGGCGVVEECIVEIQPFSTYTLDTFLGPFTGPGVKYWRVRSYHGEAAAGTSGPMSGPSAVTAWSTVRSFVVPAVPPELVSLTVTNLTPDGLAVRSHTHAFSGVSPDNKTFGTIQLTGPAPPGGATVTLASSDPAVASVPASVVVAAGEASVGFDISPGQVLVDTPVTLSATFDGKTVTAPLTIMPTSLRRLDVGAGRPAPSTFSAGKSIVTTLMFNGLAPDGSVIELSSDSPAVTVPPSVTVSNPNPTNFTLVTNEVTTTTHATVTARWRGGSVTDVVTVHPPPTLVSPTTGSTFASGQTIIFRWSALSNLSSWLQVDESPLFTAPLVREFNTAGGEHQTNTLPSGTLYWRVIAKDAYGEAGRPSETRTLTISAPSGPLATPTLSFPANDARLSAGQHVAFMWSTVTGAATYTLQVDDSETFSSPFVVNHTTTSNEYSTTTLPARRMWWRVRATASDGRTSSWSAVRRLEVR